MKFLLKSTIYLLPIFLMGVSFLSIILPWFQINFDYTLWGNIGGDSVFTSILFIYIFYYGNYCTLTKILPFGLLASNIVNIWGVFFPKYYKPWYEIVIFSVILSSIVIYKIKKRLKK